LREAAVEVGAGAAPVERRGGVVVQHGEGEQARLHGGEVGEVIRGEDFALDDGEVDRDLIEPGRMDGEMDEDEVRLARPQALGGGLAAMAAAVVHDPEDARG